MSNSKSNELVGATTKLVAGLVLIAVAPVTRAWVLCRLWAWFVVPLGPSQVGMAHMYGLTLFVGLAHMYLGPKNTLAEEKPWVWVLSVSIALPAMSLGLGWLAHWLGS